MAATALSSIADQTTCVGPMLSRQSPWGFDLRFAALAILALASGTTIHPVHAQQSNPTNQPVSPQPASPGAGNAPPTDATPNSPSPSTPANQGVRGSLNNVGIPATVLPGDQAQGVLGKQVRSISGEDMGRIVDVVVDRSARVQGAVIDFGGFLGVGSRQIAVGWNALRFASDNKLDLLIVDFTRDQLKIAPAYKAGEQIVLLGPPAIAATPPAAPAVAVPAAPAPTTTTGPNPSPAPAAPDAAGTPAK